jgi:hypothetical protein
MSIRIGIVATLAVTALIVFLSVAVLQARAIDRKAQALRVGMTLPEVMSALDGWWMVNTHPLGRGTGRGRPQAGAEYNGYTGRDGVYVLTPLAADGRETDLRKLSRAVFTERLNGMLAGGEQWTAYFSYRTVPTQRGLLVRFDGHGRLLAIGAAAAASSQ